MPSWQRGYLVGKIRSMLGLRLPELLIILVVLVLLFGAKKIPDLGDALGKGIRAFKKASDKGFAEDDSSSDTAKGPAQQGELPHGSATSKPPSAAAEKKG
jgi:sec-independent protein translocase protein TatA